MCKRGTTSKISDYADIFSIKSLGFRGEALSSLCNIGVVVVQTKQKDSETGWSLEYDRFGTLTKQTKISKNPGTSVSVREIFGLLPVRLSEFKKSHKT